MLKRIESLTVFALLAAMLPMVGQSQTLRSEYEKAATLGKQYGSLALNIPGKAHWIGMTDRFWYGKTVQGGHAFVLVNAATEKRGPTFDQAKLAAAYNKASGKDVKALKLPFAEFHFGKDRKSIDFAADGWRWKCTLDSYVCKKAGKDLQWWQEPRWASPKNDPDHVVASPNGKWVGFIQNFNVWVRQKGSKKAVALSTDGSEGNFYTFRSLAWSPNSEDLVAYRIRPGFHRLVHYVQAAPPDELQPTSYTMEYPKPGDVLQLQQPVLFHVADRKEFRIDNSLFPNPYQLSDLKWWKDSRGFTFQYLKRGNQVLRVIDVDAKTGEPQVLINETSKTFIDYTDLSGDQYGSGWTYRHDIQDGKEIIWMSEKDGWPHLYLYNGMTGKLENKITSGPWVVRYVNYVDAKNRQIYFEASGMDSNVDPYWVYEYRINFDGTGLKKLTSEAGNHQTTFSKDGKYYVDTWSTVSEAPTMVLKRTSDNKVLMHLEHGDISKLLAAGWKPPIVFHTAGRDGKTQIWGVIHPPLNFDPHKKYPVVEDIYAGPQGAFAPHTFSTRLEPLTALGFAVAQVDGMGTNNRGKAFRSVIWKNLKDAGFPDRVLWHNAAAKKYPWYDISHGVGIFGTSAGGQDTLSALLFHPDFYTVGVANSGCYDNRMDKMWWNELWMGWPIGPQYAASSDVVNAHLLKGKLLLFFGGMDHNVDPSSTLQVVNALITANKDFSLLEVPNGDHGVGIAHAYVQRKLEDFFVKNMEHKQPPDWNRDPGKWFKPGQEPAQEYK